jgi:hypothetical protein
LTLSEDTTSGWYLVGTWEYLTLSFTHTTKEIPSSLRTNAVKGDIRIFFLTGITAGTAKFADIDKTFFEFIDGWNGDLT